MSRYERNARAGANRASLYDDITNKIIAELEAGHVPWVQPWGTAAAKAPLAMPANAATGRAYSGINVLVLWGAVIEHGFPIQSWLTFRQALSVGGHVRKGERGTTVVYADRFIPDDKRKRAQETGEEARLNGEIKRRTEVLGIFLNEEAITRLVGAILLEQNDEWAVQRARYMTVESVAQLSDDPLVTLPPMAA